MMRKIIFCCLLAVLTISCANKNESPWLTKNDLDGRVFSGIGREVTYFSGDSIIWFTAKQETAKGVWVTHDTILVKVDDYERSWYIDKDYHAHSFNDKYKGIKISTPRLNYQLTELFEKRKSPWPQRHQLDTILTYQPWVLYPYLKEYKEPTHLNHKNNIEREEFFSNESRANFSSEPFFWMTLNNDTTEHYDWRKGTIFNNYYSNNGQEKITHSIHFGGYFEYKTIDGERFSVQLYEKEEGHYIGRIGLISSSTGRIKPYYYWIEPMTLDNVLPFLPKDL